MDYLKVLFLWFIVKLPSVFGGNKIRNLYYKRFFLHSEFVIPENVIISDIKNIKIGRSFRVCPYVKLFTENKGSIIIGNNFFANYNCFFSANKEDIVIGDDCLLGPDVLIINSNHDFQTNILVREQANLAKKISIGNNVWIGAKSVILPGVSIGDNAVVAAGSIVNKSIEANTLVGGIPAKIIKYIK
ncbi:acyltransferase [Flavobacterium sp. NPDC079362]|uniref:acyltransferase n=1 Tax=Flavobacterium sp. NPDC079362 TaxID=3390566 RepID=UPI003D0017C9